MSSTVTLTSTPPTPSTLYLASASTHKPSRFKSNSAKQRKRAPAKSPSPIEGTSAPQNCENEQDREIQAEERPKRKQKQKQSKSRNGCVTCKAKRFKCDETHPTCLRCTKRNVVCGGYKKDFKWKPVEEQTLQKPGAVKARRSSTSQSWPQPLATSASSASQISFADGRHSFSASQYPSRPNLGLSENDEATIIPHMFGSNATSPPPRNCVPSSAPLKDAPNPSVIDPGLCDQPPLLPPTTISEDINLGLTADLQCGEQDGPDLREGSADQKNDIESPIAEVEEVVVSNMSRPRGNTTASLEFNFEALHAAGFLPELPGSHDHTGDIDLDGFGFDTLDLGFPDPSDPEAMSMWDDPFRLLFKEPRFDIGSREMLMARFDQNTCAIMSVKDGPNENPWRTLVGPLVGSDSLLYHATASMACFHSSKQVPELRVLGMQHVQDTISGLRDYLNNADPNRLDAAIATTMALAFSESWDKDGVATGIDYVKVARGLIHQAVNECRQRPRAGPALQRLKFLCKTWIYLDVIARLTSVYEDISNDVETVSAMLTAPLEAETEIDPLMGCASTLFPIIGRVANLVRTVCRSRSNTPTIISMAGELKTILENWVAPSSSFCRDPEDPTSTVQHSLQTAEAYRWATLLHLHQAVPETPSMSSEDLADRVLTYLATVPLSSRAVVVQIYPLLVAGCEAKNEETRQWIRDRWEAMADRMAIGNIDRCADVVREVWRRRDAYAAAKKQAAAAAAAVAKRTDPSADSPFIISKHGSIISGMESLEGFPHWADPFPSYKRRESSNAMRTIGIGGSRRREREMPVPAPLIGGMDAEFTARGRLHWIGVMMEWKWEVLLG